MTKRPFLLLLLFCFLLLYFLDYLYWDNCNSIINKNNVKNTVVPIFSLLPSSTQHPSLPQAIPHHYSCPWVMHITSLAAPFPTPFFTSPWLFCNYIFVLLNPLTSSPILPHPPPNWQHINISESTFLSLFFFA